MIEYIWLDDKRPILNQFPSNFKSAAMLFNPFIQMPFEWVQLQSENKYEHIYPIYPSNEEILKYGKPVRWREIMQESGFENYKELVLAMKTSILALKKEYLRTDLAEKIDLRKGVYYPSEDCISPFLIEGIFEILSSKGANNICFAAPIDNEKGLLQINATSLLEICDLTDQELILIDENLDFAFMSVYDSFITLFLSKEKNISNVIEVMNWEAFICDEQTSIDWYF